MDTARPAHPVRADDTTLTSFAHAFGARMEDPELAESIDPVRRCALRPTLHSEHGTRCRIEEALGHWPQEVTRRQLDAAKPPDTSPELS